MKRGNWKSRKARKQDMRRRTNPIIAAKLPSHRANTVGIGRPNDFGFLHTLALMVRSLQSRRPQ